METIVNILSVIASLLSIISIIMSVKNKKAMDLLLNEVQSGDKNIKSRGQNNINNTGDGNKIRQ